MRPLIYWVFFSLKMSLLFVVGLWEPGVLGILKKVLEILEEDWILAKSNRQRFLIARTGAWFLSALCSGLRGEEMLLLDFKGTETSLKFLMVSYCPHFELVVIGPIEGYRNNGTKFKIPVASVTEGNHLMAGCWMKRYIEIISILGYKPKRLFFSTNTSAKLSDFESDFYDILCRVQSSSNAINDDIDVREEFGLRRSIRRGVTSHARNMNVDSDVIHVINRWKKEGVKTSKNIIELYSEFVQLKPTLLIFSRSL